MRSTPWLAILRSVLAIVMVATITACATSSSSAGVSAPPSVSAAPTSGDSASPASSPSSAGDALENVPSVDGALNAVWITDDTIVAGGFAGPAFTSTIITFEQGTWSVADVPTSTGQVTGIAELDDRLIAVGNALPDATTGFIWESPDGRVWRTVQTIEDAALYDVVAGDGMVVAVGASLDAEMNATALALSSTDGTTWEPGTVAAAAETAMGSVTTTPDGFAATGDRPLGVPRPFWSAMTATSWTSLENDLSDQLLPIDIVHDGDGLALVGASGKSGDQHPFVALSADGQAWEQTNFSNEEGYASAVAVADGGLVVAGVDADRLTLWSLLDGAWQAETFDASGASISALAWDVDLGLVAVGSRDGRHAVWRFE